MFSSDDFKVASMSEFFELLPVFLFLGLVGPFLLAAYSIGFFLDKAGMLESK